VSGMKRLLQKVKSERIGYLLQLAFYYSISVWLIFCIINVLVSAGKQVQILSLDYIKEMPAAYFLGGVLIALAAPIIIMLVPIKSDKLKLGQLFLLISFWLFVAQLWYIDYIDPARQQSLSYCFGLLLLCVFLLAATRNFLTANRESKLFFYTAWALFISGILLAALNVVNCLIILPAITADAEQKLMRRIILTLVLALQGALAGAVAAHLLPDVAIIKKPYGPSAGKYRVYYLVGFAFLIHVSLFGYILYVRTITLTTPTYDFGIFSQMFHNMSETGLPTTTLERSYELSHFAVHVSPIYYLLLPLYLLTKSPVTLQLAQIVLVASGVIPLFLIMRFLNWPNRRAAVFSLLYLAHPALSGSSMYDLHENFFLAPLLLWLLLFVLKNNTIGTFVFTALVLAVKEDAAIYIILIGFWMLWSQRTNKRHGIIMLLLGLAWFVLALYWLNTRGLGAMDSRFANLMAWPEYGLPGVILTSLLHPAYVLTRIFTAEKLIYILTMMAPLAFLPLLRKPGADHILLLPWLIMNLIPDYQYQHNINFQYHYGTGVLLIFATILSVEDMFQHSPSFYRPTLPRQARLRQLPYAKTKAILYQRQYPSKSYLALSMVSGIILVSALFFGATVFAEHYVPRATVRQRQQIAQEMKYEMDQIPHQASVRATTWLTTYLSGRSKLIDLDYEHIANAETWQADYIVIDLRYNRKEAFAERIETAIAQGYLIKVELPDKILILQHPSAAE
jgi:uncharacterized membrane protein